MAADEIDLRDEDRLPWLETVEPDEEESGPGIWRVAVAVLVGLALVAAAAFAWFRLKGPAGPADGKGELIAAQEGDYKVKPDDPGGLKVNGEGDAAIATSAGASGNSAIDLKAVPETPITGRRATTRPAGETGATTATSNVPASTGRLTAAPPMAPPHASVPGAASGGRLVQLGAFPSEGAANAAWSAVAKRFGYVAALGKEVVPAAVAGRTVYRLRVDAGSPGAAADVCGRLKVAGEGCFVTS